MIICVLRSTIVPCVIFEPTTTGSLREVEQAVDFITASLKAIAWLEDSGATLPDGRAIDTRQDHLCLLAVEAKAVGLPPGYRSVFKAYILRDTHVFDAGLVLAERWVVVSGGGERKRSIPTVVTNSPKGSSKGSGRANRPTVRGK